MIIKKNVAFAAYKTVNIDYFTDSQNNFLSQRCAKEIMRVTNVIKNFLVATLTKI